MEPELINKIVQTVVDHHNHRKGCIADLNKDEAEKLPPELKPRKDILTVYRVTNNLEKHGVGFYIDDHNHDELEELNDIIDQYDDSDDKTLNEMTEILNKIIDQSIFNRTLKTTIRNISNHEIKHYLLDIIERYDENNEEIQELDNEYSELHEEFTYTIYEKIISGNKDDLSELTELNIHFCKICKEPFNIEETIIKKSIKKIMNTFSIYDDFGIYDESVKYQFDTISDCVILNTIQIKCKNGHECENQMLIDKIKKDLSTKNS